MPKGHVRAFPLLALLLLLLFAAAPADANRSPVDFSVTNNGMGLPTTPNGVFMFNPDGAHLFRSSGLFGLWPDGTNAQWTSATSLGLYDLEEIDAISWGADPVVPPEAIQAGLWLEFYFSVEAVALGVPGPWPPDVAAEGPRSAAEVFFAWPWFWPYGSNHLGVPAEIAGLDPGPPDDLDAMNFGLLTEPEPGRPVYFSVDRSTCGFQWTASYNECQNPAPPEQAADIFFSPTNGTNFLFADEAMMGLDGNDDNIDALALYDTGPGGLPNLEVDPGLDYVYFSLDFLSQGLPGTAVYAEANAGNIAGDIFFSDFTGTNVKVLDGGQLGLLEPIPPMPFTPDEDNLNALDVEEWIDTDGDDIPDVVDNCPLDYNPMQTDINGNGIGDACDPTDVESRPEGAGVRFGIRAASPNPFRPSTTITFALPEAGDVGLEVYGVTGRRVATLFRGPAGAGVHVAEWDGRSADGAPVAPGVYFVRLRAGDRVDTAKIVRLD